MPSVSSSQEVRSSQKSAGAFRSDTEVRDGTRLNYGKNFMNCTTLSYTSQEAHLEDSVKPHAPKLCMMESCANAERQAVKALR